MVRATMMENGNKVKDAAMTFWKKRPKRLRQRVARSLEPSHMVLRSVWCTRDDGGEGHRF